jgi:hypothetical protein
MEPMRGTRIGGNGPSETERFRLRRAQDRVMPLRTPSGTVFGYLVRGRRGRLPHGPYATAEGALDAALADMAAQSEQTSIRWARQRREAIA